MKTLISNLPNLAPGDPVTIDGWVLRARYHHRRRFVDVEDRTGTVQCVTEGDKAKESLPPESAVQVLGRVAGNGNGVREIHADSVTLVGQAEPGRVQQFRLMDHDQVAKAGLGVRHLAVRAPSVVAAMRFRAEAGTILRSWLDREGFVSVDTPVLASVPLYDDHTAIGVAIGASKKAAFLTQCSGFYLEALACGLDRAYNLGPSFRAEEGRSPRHLNEYWHVKAEAMWVRFPEILELTERFVREAVLGVAPIVERYGPAAGGRQTPLVLDSRPFPRVSYRDALALSQKAGEELVFGQSLSGAAERTLADTFGDRPFWIVGNPRRLEPFPYVIDPDDPELTLTADLVVPDGYGEILGVAEKISSLAMLDERMAEKNRGSDHRYQWVRETRVQGMPWHSGFGMGFERFLRWTLGLPTVADCIAFPRAIDRQIHP